MKKMTVKRRNYQKRSLAGILAAAVVLAGTGAGCGLGETKKRGVYLEDDDYLITVGFAQGGEDSPWKTANTESLKTTLTEDNGYELLWEDAQDDQEAQIATVRSFLEQDVDYIVLDPVVETGWETVLKEAKEAAVPVIVSNRRIDVEDTSLYTCWLGGDFGQEGTRAGEWLEDYFDAMDKENSSREDGEKYLAIVQGDIGNYMQMERMEGLGTVLADHSDWILTGQQTAEGDREKAKEVTRLFLENSPEPDVLVIESGDMAMGALEALEEAGRSSGPEGDTAVLVFGAGQEVLEAMKEGKINVAFDNSPLFGPRIAEIIRRLESGVAIDREQYMENETIEPGENLDEWMENAVY